MEKDQAKDFDFTKELPFCAAANQEGSNLTGFYAMLHRMRYINRWSLMKNTELENIMEHSYETSVIAHALALIRLVYFPQAKISPAPEKVALFALYHDLPEILTGDLPTPVKYATKEMQDSYASVEMSAAKRLLAMLPPSLEEHYRSLILPDKEDEEIKEIMQLVKAADRFSAYIKCLDEIKAGNLEFKNAIVKIKEKLELMELPEISWFMENVIPSYCMTLDELEN